MGDVVEATPGSGAATAPAGTPGARSSSAGDVDAPAPRGDGPGIGTGAPMTRRELRALREAAEARSAAATASGPVPSTDPPAPTASARRPDTAEARPFPDAGIAASASASAAPADASSASASAAGIAAASAATAASSDRAPRREDRAPRREDRAARPPAAPRSVPTKPKRRHPKWPYVVVLLVALFGGAAVIATSLFGPVVSALLSQSEPTDYDGDGSGEVQVVVKTGDTGSTIGDTLASQDVIKTSKAFYQAVVRSGGEIVFQPGTYTLRKQMSAASALQMLQDPASQVQAKVTIPEGQTAAQAFELVAEGTGTPVADLEAAAADRAALGIPAEAPGIEGYLFPATYDFPPGTSATDMVKAMVARTFAALDQAGVPAADRHRVLTLAALIQKEARFEGDFYKVSRVFQNRIAIGMPLQSDATVAYGARSAGRVTTTDAERADDNPYNTYVHPGLPVGPISNPGDLAIKAAMAPEEGPWLYFVTVNTITGDTVFSQTYDEHLKAVAQWQQFMKDNPGNG
ncbi:putative aminodeoxychorismate lyase [Clavibacter michiganensis]|uniref:Endolytic murein transglycosylase n=1 Tax=Clavibacter michiganensis TaxID=28447 RepID=A0A251Y5F5_9MICO|nr:endolytic transglycosylase MltG [Clavibacter michiganensis]OUE19510.1 putative aminodeoxychorismate lyase [Clavibacter michiganensis]